MLFSLASRILSSTAAFIYPTYASYKSLSHRPASEADLERWLMYWSVLGVIMAVEYVAEWAISWIPFYWTIKTCLLLWLALPQFQGSTYLYRTQLAPLLTVYEPTIDSYLSQYKANLYTFLQAKLRLAWEAITAIIAKQTGVNLNAQNPDASNAAQQGQDQPETAAGGSAGGGAAQVALGLWRTWGPSVVSALKPLQEHAQRAAAEAAAAKQTASEPRQARPTGPVPLSATSQRSGSDSVSAIAARRRQLEAELAALPSIPSTPSQFDNDNERQTTPTPPDFSNVSALAHSVYLSDSASESENGSLATAARGRYEEINRDDVSDDDRDGSSTGQAARPTSWFGNWRRSSAYERVKSE